MRSRPGFRGCLPAGELPADVHIDEVFERSRSKSSPLEQTRSKLANPVELTGFDQGLAAISTGVAIFNRDLLIGIFWTGFTLSGLYRSISSLF